MKKNDFDTYFFNDLYSDDLITNKFASFQNRLYHSILRGKAAIQHNKVLNGPVTDIIMDETLNLTHGMPARSYSVHLNESIVPYYSEERFAHEYGYEKPISLLTLLDDTVVFSKHMYFFINGYFINNIQIHIGKNDCTIFIPTSDDSNTHMNRSQLEEIIAEGKTWSLFFSTKSDFYAGYTSRLKLFTGTKIYTSNLKRYKAYNRLVKRNAWTMYITAKQNSTDIMVGTSVTMGVDDIGEYFEMSQEFYDYIYDKSINFRCLIVNEPDSTGNGIYINTDDTRPIFTIPFERNPIPVENLIIWKYDHVNGIKQMPLAGYGDVKLTYPNIYDFTKIIEDEIYIPPKKEDIIVDGPSFTDWRGKAYTTKFIRKVEYPNHVMERAYDTEGNEYYLFTKSNTGPLNFVFVVSETRGVIPLYSNNMKKRSHRFYKDLNSNVYYYAIGVFYNDDTKEWFLKLAPENLRIYTENGISKYLDGALYYLKLRDGEENGIDANNADLSTVYLRYTTAGIYDMHIEPSANMDMISRDYKTVCIDENNSRPIVPDFPKDPGPPDPSWDDYTKFDLFIEWVEPSADASAYDSYLQDYMDCYREEFADMIVNQTAHPLVLSFKPLQGIGLSAEDYFKSEFKGDYRGWRLQKFIEMMGDNPNRYDEVFELLYYMNRKYLSKTYTYESHPHIYDRNITTNRDFCEPKQELVIDFPKPQGFLRIHDFMEEKKPTFIYVNGIRHEVTYVSKWGHILHIYFPVELIQNQETIQLNIDFENDAPFNVNFVMGDSFDLGTLKELGDYSLSELIFYDTETGEIFDSSVLDFVAKIEYLDLEYLGDEKVDVESAMDTDVSLYDYYKRKFVPGEEYDCFIVKKQIIQHPVENPENGKKIPIKHIIVHPKPGFEELLKGKRISITTTNFHKKYIFTMDKEYIIENGYNYTIPEFKGKGVKERFRVYLNGRRTSNFRIEKGEYNSDFKIADIFPEWEEKMNTNLLTTNTCRLMRAASDEEIYTRDEIVSMGCCRMQISNFRSAPVNVLCVINIDKSDTMAEIYTSVSKDDETYRKFSTVDKYVISRNTACLKYGDWVDYYKALEPIEANTIPKCFTDKNGTMFYTLHFFAGRRMYITENTEDKTLKIQTLFKSTDGKWFTHKANSSNSIDLIPELSYGYVESTIFERNEVLPTNKVRFPNGRIFTLDLLTNFNIRYNAYENGDYDLYRYLINPAPSFIGMVAACYAVGWYDELKYGFPLDSMGFSCNTINRTIKGWIPEIQHTDQSFVFDCFYIDRNNIMYYGWKNTNDERVLTKPAQNDNPIYYPVEKWYGEDYYTFDDIDTGYLTYIKRLLKNPFPKDPEDPSNPFAECIMEEYLYEFTPTIPKIDTGIFELPDHTQINVYENSTTGNVEGYVPDTGKTYVIYYGSNGFLYFIDENGNRVELGFDEVDEPTIGDILPPALLPDDYSQQVLVDYIGFDEVLVLSKKIKELKKTNDEILYLEDDLDTPYNRMVFKIYIDGYRISDDQIKIVGQGNMIMILPTYYQFTDESIITIYQQGHDKNLFREEMTPYQFLDEVAQDDDRFRSYLIEKYKTA